MQLYFLKPDTGAKVTYLYQWDTNVNAEFSLPESSTAIEAVFSTIGMKEGIRKTCTYSDGKWTVNVPDKVLIHGTNVSAYITYVDAESRRTVEECIIAVRKSAKPEGYVSKDESVYASTDEMIQLATKAKEDAILAKEQTEKLLEEFSGIPEEVTALKQDLVNLVNGVEYKEEIKKQIEYVQNKTIDSSSGLIYEKSDRMVTEDFISIRELKKITFSESRVVSVFCYGKYDEYIGVAINQDTVNSLDKTKITDVFPNTLYIRIVVYANFAETSDYLFYEKKFDEIVGISDISKDVLELDIEVNGGSYTKTTDTQFIYTDGKTIDGSTGIIKNNSERCATENYYPVDNFVMAEISEASKLYKLFCYDDNKSYLGSTQYLSTRDFYKSDITSVNENAKYFRIIRYVNDTSVIDIAYYEEVVKSEQGIKQKVSDIGSDLDMLCNTIYGNPCTKVTDIPLVYTNGYTIESETGLHYANQSRRATLNYYDVKNLKNVTFSNSLGYAVYCYDSSKLYIGKVQNWEYDTGFTVSHITDIYPTAKYFRIVRYEVESEVSDIATYEEIIYEGLIAEINKKADKSDFLTDGFAYSGERIVLDNFCKYEKLGYTCNGQDAAQFGKYLFAFSETGNCKVINTEDNTTIANFNIDGTGTVKPHCNSAVFGNEYHTDGDMFPLVYVNAYNTAGLPKGTLYAHRILTDSNGIPTGTSLVQTITIGFTDDIFWTESGDSRPYGNFCIDTDNGYLWAYTLLDTSKVTRFYKFKLPTISDGVSVTLNKTDVLEYFDVQLLSYIQGCTYNAGKIYVLSGFGTNEYPGLLSVVNLYSHKIVTQIDFNKNLSLSWEPEFINVVDKNLVIGKIDAYRFTF